MDKDFDDINALILSAYARTGSLRKTAKELNVSRYKVKAVLTQSGVDTTGSSSAQEALSTPKVFDETKDGQRVVTARGIRSVEDLLVEADIDPEQWIVVKHLANKWDALSKNGEVVELFQVKAWLERKPGWDLKPIEVVTHVKRAPVSHKSDLETALIVPDSQHGFRRQEDGTLVPLHDRAALDVAIQAARLLAPDEIVMLGDMLDLAPWSTKYTTDPSLRYTTMPAMQELFYFIQQLRLAAPSARIVWLEGNHEARINDALTLKIDEALYLRRVTNPETRPVLSIPYLMNLDSIDVEYLGPYGAEHWLFDEIRIHHGSVVRGRSGATVGAMLDEPVSQIVGHIHRREIATRKIKTKSGPKLISAMSPGCLCRTDGVVPGRKGGYANWHHGLGIVWKYRDSVNMQLIPINDGTAIINGHPLVGDPQVEAIRRATGLPL
tara:strand:+ start:6063 stop:7376 length:1314 start_codon:yes stop_codon:yes gene_type:complete